MAEIKLVVACALIDIDGRVLLQQRPEGKQHAGLWEFPGGKVDAGETTNDAIIRELKEELNIDVTAACLAPLCFSTIDSEINTSNLGLEIIHLLMPLFICRRWHGMVQPMLGQNLKWVQAKKLKNYPMPPADIPFIPNLIDILP
ncbi:MAG: (deoxy)nucleoside triphosphate pyrophosphohydrolase [Rhizobiales bacterium]|nr:(deoxy)nucleoside triphosphate pyrophosphohydrolase [Hyphomicrobiales bacterium]NRB15692.1 (deoxy)nucleoside triphosphate pyrophosphohydrolase [Hyphomicrobiales bacterium]